MAFFRCGYTKKEIAPILKDGTSYGSLVTNLQYPGQGSSISFSNGVLTIDNSFGYGRASFYADITNYTELHIKIKTSSFQNIDNSYQRIIISDSSSGMTSCDLISNINSNINDYTEFVFNISVLTGYKYIGIDFWANNSSLSNYIYCNEIYLR